MMSNKVFCIIFSCINGKVLCFEYFFDDSFNGLFIFFVNESIKVVFDGCLVM